MEKSHYNKEINRLLKEATKIREKTQLDYDTAIFLDNEAIQLEKIIDCVNSTKEQVEDAMKKLEALYKRIENELGHTHDDDAALLQIENELFILNDKASSEGLTD